MPRSLGARRTLLKINPTFPQRKTYSFPLSWHKYENKKFQQQTAFATKISSFLVLSQ